MKITREQLVDLLTTATYGSDWLEIKTLKSEKSLDESFDANYLNERCREDKWVDRLLCGGRIVCLDWYRAEDYEDEKPIGIVLSLRDMEDAIERATTDRGIVRECAEWLVGDGDYYTANNLLQYIMFGEVIYG